MEMESDFKAKKGEGRGEKNNGKRARKVDVNHVILIVRISYSIFLFPFSLHNKSGEILLNAL